MSGATTVVCRRQSDFLSIFLSFFFILLFAHNGSEHFLARNAPVPWRGVRARWWHRQEPRRGESIDGCWGYERLISGLFVPRFWRYFVPPTRSLHELNSSVSCGRRGMTWRQQFLTPCVRRAGVVRPGRLLAEKKTSKRKAARLESSLFREEKTEPTTTRVFAALIEFLSQTVTGTVLRI